VRTTTLIEFSHRWITVLATGLIVALALTAWLTQRQHRRLLVGSTVALGLLVLQIALGAIVVEFNLPGGLVMVHLANALLLLSVLVYVAVISYSGGGLEAEEEAVSVAAATTPGGVVGRSMRPAGTAAVLMTPSTAPSSASTLTAVAAFASYILALSGAFIVENGAGGACAGWPLCGNGFQLPASQFATINVAHRIIAGIVVIYARTPAVKQAAARRSHGREPADSAAGCGGGTGRGARSPWCHPCPAHRSGQRAVGDGGARRRVGSPARDQRRHGDT
jgi:heme A synthase